METTNIKSPTMKFSALQIKILLHYYTSPTDWEFSSTVSDEAMDILRGYDLVQVKEVFVGTTHYAITKRGVAHVEQLLKIQPPKEAWVDSNGKLILTK